MAEGDSSSEGERPHRGHGLLVEQSCLHACWAPQRHCLLRAWLAPPLAPSSAEGHDHVEALLQHLHNWETRFCCPQAFLCLDFQCRDDVSELKQTFLD